MRREQVFVNMTPCSDSLTSSYADTCTEAMFSPELNFTTAHCVFRSQQSGKQRRSLPEHTLTPAWSRMCRIILPAQSLPDRATYQSITHTQGDATHHHGLQKQIVNSYLLPLLLSKTNCAHVFSLLITSFASC